MLATEAFGLTRTDADDWFDTILDVDTRLFVDPFLLFKEAEVKSRWTGAHAKMIDHFEQAFLLIADSTGPESLASRKAERMLVFKEPREMCLGYTDDGTDGQGSGKGFARLIVQHMARSIERGLERMEHFEELAILNKGIGRDRISDAACTILKPELIAYTQDIAARHGLGLEEHKVYGAEFDTRRQRFTPPATARVLTNPVNGRPLIFVPRRFLRDLPTLNDRDWFADDENQMLRDDLSYEIVKNVRKETIVERARSKEKRVRQWTEAQESTQPTPYDEERDPEGLLKWEPETRAFTAANPLSLQVPDNDTQFVSVIETIIEQYRLFIEQQNGWYLLWDGTKDKKELALQLVLYGIARNYCKANNIVVSREVEIGRGPVDFTFSNGYSNRAHIEAKKTHNGKFWNGLDYQLPSYLLGDEATLGWFLAVRFRSGKTWDERDAELPKRVKAAATRHGLDLRVALVDARRPESASNITA